MKPVIIIAIAVVGIGIIIIILIVALYNNQESMKIDEPKTLHQMFQELEKWCDKNFLEYDFSSGEECYAKQKAIFDPRRDISGCMEHFSDMKFSSNEECFQYSQTRNQPYDSDDMKKNLEK